MIDIEALVRSIDSLGDIIGIGIRAQQDPPLSRQGRIKIVSTPECIGEWLEENRIPANHIHGIHRLTEDKIIILYVEPKAPAAVKGSAIRFTTNNMRDDFYDFC